MDASEVARLREALQQASFTVDAVHELLGPVAHGALGREQVVPGLRATTGGSALETLVRVFLLGTTEPAEAVAAAVRPLGPSAALAAGLLESDGDGLRAALEIRPYGDDRSSWWVVSDVGTDVRPGALRRDHVLGIGGASVTLAQWTVRHDVESALDLGTGCGVQALHLSAHAAAVTATDRNPRAVRLAALTAALNGLDWDLLVGDLLQPVRDRMFDLVVSNPPFVVGPASRGYAYRDSGLAGDAVSERLVREAPAALNDGGWCQLLANWVHVRGEPWDERVHRWLAGNRCDTWVVQREVQDPAEYVEMWLHDSGEASGAAYRQRYAEWLDWFVANDVDAVGFGVVSMRRSGRDQPDVVVEELRQPVAPPLGPHVTARFARVDWLRDADLLDARLRAAADVRLHQVASPGPDGWAVGMQRLVLDSGLGWSGDIDPIGAALVGGANGDVRLRDQLELLAIAFDIDLEALTNGALPAVRHLVERGFLEPG
jgi:methylase of polypeptide subunit release factors